MKKILIAVMVVLLVATNSVTLFAQTGSKIDLTEKEKEYIRLKGPIKVVVDPDWYPYEKNDKNGEYVGISADLIALITQRTGLKFEVIATSSWKASLNEAKSGRADVVSLLNKTDERSKWLLFTEPYFDDSNVLITREEHDYISNLSRFNHETMVLPEGTSIEERVRKDYPTLKIILVQSEGEAIRFIEEKKADFTLRSLTMAAYVIKNDGHFNLKIAGEIPEYKNHLRMGITKQDTMLQSILNKGIETITEQDVQTAINKHISIRIMKGFDYKLFFIIFGIFSVVLLLSLYWVRKIQKLNKNLEISENGYKTIAEELKEKNALLEASATTDTLTGLKNRLYFNHRVNEEFDRVKRYHTELSLLMLDIDHFKRINDLYGHAGGDEVLKKVSNELQNHLRNIDLVARWGGEEFIVLLPETGMNDAIVVAKKLRKQVEELCHENHEVVTISIGISTITEMETIESLIARADKALYHAKRQGRNRCCTSSEVYDEDSFELVKWNPTWISGHKDIDQQHMELLEMCNELMSRILRVDSQESILPNLKDLIIHIQKHFEYEEEVLRQFKYADAELHKKNHEDLVIKAMVLFKRSDDGLLLPFDVAHFIVNDVLIMHLLKEDTKFFKMFNEKK